MSDISQKQPLPLLVKLAAAQKEFTSAIRDSNNPFFRSKYADLSAVWDACKQGLGNHNLFISQQTRIGEKGEVILITKVYDEYANEISSEFPVIVNPGKNGENKENPQAFGSALTYARRYQLASILGIVTEDDDAETAVNRAPATPAKQEAKPTKQAPNPGPVTPTTGSHLQQGNPITNETKAEILKMLNHRLITEQEKQRGVKGINEYTQELGLVVLGKLKDVIKKRELAEAQHEGTQPQTEPEEETGEVASDAQKDLLWKILSSHVVTDQERAEVKKRMPNLTKNRCTGLIESWSALTKSRKATEARKEKAA